MPSYGSGDSTSVGFALRRAIGSRTAQGLLLAAVLVLASLLRLRALDVPPLWWDEGNNAYFAHQSLPRLLEMSRLTHDTDPPAHRLALAVWLGLLGDSACNLRLLSAVCGILTVLLVFHWGRSLGGFATGLAAALLVACSPMAVFYSREAKSYTFVTLFGTVAVYVWARYLDSPSRPRPKLWAAYVLCGALALGAHYYAAFLSIAQAAWLAVDVLGARRARPESLRRVRNWLVAQVGTVAIVLPWILLTWDTALDGAKNVPMAQGALPPLAYLKEVLFCLAAGPHAPDWTAALALVVLGSAVIWELCHARRGQRWLLAIIVVLPVVIGCFAQQQIPFSHPRFFLYVTPALYLLAALALTRLRRAGTILALLLAVSWGVALPTAYTPFAPPEEDLRPLAVPLRDLAQPDDGIIVGYIWQEGILRMYAPAGRASYHLGWFEREAVGESMNVLFARHPRLWLVTYRAPLQHPSNPGGWWLEQYAARALVAEHGHSRIALYLRPCTEAFQAPEAMTFSGGIQLRYKPITGQATAGQALAMALQWGVDEPPSERFAVFVHLVDDCGKLWAQSDGEPQNGLVPFPRFARGQRLIECRAIVIPPEIPQGDYGLLVGLYHPETGKRLQVVGVDGGIDHCRIGRINVLGE